LRTEMFQIARQERRGIVKNFAYIRLVSALRPTWAIRPEP